MNRIIGLQTPHYAPNYGAKLQAFAVAETLRHLGFDIEYINRRPIKASMYDKFINRWLAGIEEKRLEQLIQFENKWLQPQTKPIFNNDDFKELDIDKYYAIVVGSDQMWRDDYFHAGFELSPYLFYVNNPQILRVAYAVSFGKNTCEHPESRRREIENLIRKFKVVSVREKSGIDILKEKFHTEGIWVCDPTLFHKAEKYIQKFKLDKSMKKDQVITSYILDQSTCFFEKSKQIAQRLGLPLFPLVEERAIELLYKRYFNRIPRFSKLPSVIDWLNQIRNSEYIVTDSYHGLLFSIIFKKQFVIYDRVAGGSERYKSILEYLGLSDRLFHKEDNIDVVVNKLKEKIDYISVEQKLETFRSLSLDYLRSALS
ncbi:MAG: polysaccharide pyruvyl transferase family protein [Prevotella sp.]|uniref:polysaccharide pyruvyl transferase family protein n=1 Tax=Prevotella sp. PTAC TaxID=2736295 RepID=UPI001553C56D|nr:polysaccharide pyruvyl transferase family protein [Prevotella sp. PTAC]MCX4294034.1 polysaccharide pyruvyl transferase family protein [Prevotella sp.]NPD53426.1 polysaccharide pyruvyl transferase family protein [Prevotella sp. PTAC]